MNPEEDRRSFRLSNPPAAGAALLAFILLLLALHLWREQARMKTELADQSAEKNRLEQALAEIRDELDFLKTREPRAETGTNPVATRPVPKARAEEQETLFLQKPTIAQTASGLTTRFGFTPAENIPLPEMITIVIRVPDSAESIIRSLKPVMQSSYSSIDFLVNPNGTLGMIEGSPADLKALEFELIVSGPTKATVRGSEGIIDFEMDISPAGCVVRKL